MIGKDIIYLLVMKLLLTTHTARSRVVSLEWPIVPIIYITYVFEKLIVVLLLHTNVQFRSISVKS